MVVSVYSDGPLRFVTKAIFNDTFGEGRLRLVTISLFGDTFGEGH